MVQHTLRAKELTRRDLIKAACMAAGATTLSALSPLPARAAEPRRPNVVFILVDDLRYDALRCLGTPFLKTPNLDRVRNEGVHFKNAFVTTSLCGPSRACFLTGTYAHRHGVMRNDSIEFDPHKTPSFCPLLQQAGYSTAHVGKWHMGVDANPRPGYDYWLSFTGQGTYHDPDLNENGRAFKASGYTTDLLTEYALKWLKQGRDPGKPFCLMLAHKAVHSGCIPAERHQQLYGDVAIPKPVSWDDALDGKPLWQRMEVAKVKWQAVIRSSRKSEFLPDRVPPVPWDGGARHLNYYRALQSVDEGVGRILQALAESGELDNTILVVAGDNGFFMGEHRRHDKRAAYEESMRIPFVLRYPKLAEAGSTVEPMVLNIDLAPTILDLAGVAVPKTMQGQSMRPLLAGEKSAWRKSFLYEYWLDLVLRNPTMAVPNMVAVRTDRWKYVRYPDINDIDELYDLKDDPHELVNLAQKPSHAQQQAALAAELERLIQETGYPRKGAAIAQKPRGLMLDYSFANITERVATVPDGSGNDNEGRFSKQKPTMAAGRRGKALEFSGREWIMTLASRSLDPSNAPWVVEAWIKATGDGAIISQGSRGRGYLLGVEKGIPVFMIQPARRLMVVEGREQCLGQWVHVAGYMTARTASLYVNGELSDSLPLLEPIRLRPTDGLSIGRDSGAQLVEEFFQTGFRGLIDRIRIHRMEADAPQMRKLFAEG